MGRMGKEQTCIAVIDGVRAEGRALLETDEILFRGTPRLKVPLADIRQVRVDGDALIVRHKGGEVSLELGAKQAAAWARRIAAPPGLLDKLGIKAEQVVVVLNVPDSGLVADVEARAGSVRRSRPGKAADLVLLGLESVEDLAALDGLAKVIRPDGAVWIVYPKGRKDIREADVMETARAAGWRDTKTARVSDTHTGLRFVIPVSSRPGASRPAAKKR